jgi:coenzyme F420-dependent oxidoreductase
MTARDVHLPVAAQESVGDDVEMGVDAEERGYDTVWLPETWGRDAVTSLALLADRTDRVGLGSSILNVYSRSPALLGQTAATLQEVSDGRFRLGVGPSGPQVVENWHGVEFGSPLKRTREAVEVVKLVTGGEAVDYDGRTVDLSGFRLRFDPPDPAPPVDAAGMGPKAVELCGRFADGWHAIVATPAGLRERMADLERGAELGDRDPEDLRVTLSLTCCALDDGEQARNLARRHLAFYVGAMGTYYRDSMARQGYEDLAHDVADAWGAGDRERAVGLLDDDVLDAFTAAGTPERARAELETFAAVDGVDAVAVSFPRGADREQVDRTLAALEPA